MAETWRQPGDQDSHMLSLLIARHHAIQARNAYGPEWHKLHSGTVSQAQVDVMIAAQKPFDYFDDFFTRIGTNISDFAEQAGTPNRRFTASFASLLCGKHDLLHQMERTDFNITLPNMIADKILDAVMDPGPTGIGEVYRQTRPDLVLPNSPPLTA